MRKRVLYGSGLVLLAILVSLVVWQGSFSFDGPSSPEQVPVFWGLSTLVFLLTVILGFMLFRTGAKLYIERRGNREGSRIKTKLVLGALALTFLPVFFLVLWSVSILNFNLARWFTRPAEGVKLNLAQIVDGMEKESRAKAQILARWLSTQPPGSREAARACAAYDVEEAWIETAGRRTAICASPGKSVDHRAVLTERVIFGDRVVVVKARMTLDLSQKRDELQNYIRQYDLLAENRKEARTLYLQLLSLITLFILFVATWLALFLARQISVPISALLQAAAEIGKGNLNYRVKTDAIDELASLVRAFNQMSQGLEENRSELENRRRFIEAILESIPTGVISIGADGRIQMVNRALRQIFPEQQVEQATRLEDLLTREDAAELRYMMKRARRTGQASRQLELKQNGHTLHLAATVAALEGRLGSGFVVVLEDTSELLRAQKATAWHEVARRIAHEIKNPLTPIALSADRIAAQLRRPARGVEFERVIKECASTIAGEVQSVKALVDEFSQFARFPAAQPVLSDLNEIAESALAVFSGRLDGITVQKDLTPNLPLVSIDREQFRRVIVNLVDNAAEAMQESLVKALYIGTRPAGEAVELVVADTGSGISPEDREKLFLPYFSTKNRGTGLGLAIVNHILSEHQANIRVVENEPVGARFIIEIPAAAVQEPQSAEVRV